MTRAFAVWFVVACLATGIDIAKKPVDINAENDAVKSAPNDATWRSWGIGGLVAIALVQSPQLAKCNSPAGLQAKLVSNARL
jgi:hypothetical protein